jgi:hypothetical protein
MHHKAIPQPDRGVQRAVLGLVLEAHPKSLAIPDLSHEIDQGEAVEGAVRELVGVGLLECSGITVRPSAAALHFERLELP